MSQWSRSVGLQKMSCSLPFIETGLNHMQHLEDTFTRGTERPLFRQILSYAHTAQTPVTYKKGNAKRKMKGTGAYNCFLRYTASSKHAQ
ncbi:hypothetical protein XENTR_v10008419 [Xenopus tropicalis]|nr:hypothetical protein XENTR_v10008419 [Xenopus tropicalis]